MGLITEKELLKAAMACRVDVRLFGVLRRAIIVARVSVLSVRSDGRACTRSELGIAAMAAKKNEKQERNCNSCRSGDRSTG